MFIFDFLIIFNKDDYIYFVVNDKTYNSVNYIKLNEEELAD